MAIAAALLLAACSPKPQATAAQLDQLARQCSAQMVANTCRTMGTSTLPSVKPGDVVFVAGVGPVDAQLLANLQAAGDRMCADVRTVCAQDWSGKPCQALKGMYAPELAASASQKP